MDGLQMRIAEALREADVAGLFREDDIRRMARAVTKGTNYLTFPATSCPGCGRTKTLIHQRARRAAIMDVSGLRSVKHVPSRCRHSTCPFKDEYVWANFVGVDKLGLMFCFERYLRFGVTPAWYHQFSRRLLPHNASFQGEAHVHHGKLLSADRDAEALRKAWFLVRILERMWERSTDTTSLRINDTVESVLAQQFNHYYAALHRRARDASAAAEVDSQDAFAAESELAERIVQRSALLRSLDAQRLLQCSRDVPRNVRAIHQRLRAYHRTLKTETYDGDIRRLHWKANAGKSLGDLVNVRAGSDEGKAGTMDVSSLEPQSSVREFAQRQRTEAQHCRWLREDVACDVTLEELADLACNTSKMVGVRSTRKHARSAGFFCFGHV